MKCPALLALPLILGACSPEPQPPVANDSVERPITPGPEVPLPTSAASPSASLVAAEAGTIPERFRGEWNRVAADCGTGRNDSRLRIEPTRLRFHESNGEIVSVRGEGLTITVRARYTGEGETWEADRSFTLSGDGKTLTSDGMARTRCP